MKINDIFRYSKPYSHLPKTIDNLPNYINTTYSDGHPYALLESGINPIAPIKSIDGNRVPAILISTSPHKTGSMDTPWQDFFDVDNGHIHYCGDNKSSSIYAETSQGNKVLIDAFKTHSSPDIIDRQNSIPIIFFKRVKVNKRIKGNVMFQGFGIVDKVQLVTQKDPSTGGYFSNYTFDFVVFDMSKESQVFNWQWITDRRNPNLSLSDTLKNAPNTWKNWIKDSSSSVEKYRRRVSTTQIYKEIDQKTIPKSKESIVLETIYNHYTVKGKHLFEGLASLLTKRILDNSGNGNYIPGWITPNSRDGGGDFIGRLDIGSGFSKLKLVVLGQAKCEKLDVPTNGNHIARTVARLKRGWIGVYVTTSYFSRSVQLEIIDDNYPILLINGKRVAQEVLSISYEKGYTDVEEFLNQIDKNYESNISRRRPEEILLFT